MNPKIKISFLFSFLFSVALYPEPSQINQSNWVHHPEIQKVRAIYTGVEQKIRNREVSVQQNEKPVPDGPYHRTIFRSKERTIKYVQEYGSDDSAWIVSQYYDGAGQLRFVFVVWNAVTGGKAEYRIYFNSKGEKIYSDRRILNPNWAFESELPASIFCRNPEEDFSR